MKMQAVVRKDSQFNVLEARMKEQGLTHGETVRADVSNVRIGSNPFGDSGERDTLFFCDMGSIDIRKIVKAGDGGELPEKAFVKGLIVESEGYYDLQDVVIRSNGVNTIEVDENSRAVFIGD